MPLAEVERAGEEGDAARIFPFVLEADRARFLVRRRGALEVAADAEAAQLAALPRLFFSFWKARPVARFQGALQHLGELSGVIHLPRGGLVGHLVGPHVVAPAQLDAVDAELGRRLVDEALHVIVRLGPAGAAVSRHRRGVGEHELRRHVQQRRAVDAHRVLHRVVGRHHRRRGADVGAEVAVAGDAQREEAPVRVEGELGGHLVVAPLLVGDEASRALVGPLHRAPQRPRRVREAHVLRVDRALHAEGAADLPGAHAHLVLGYAENVGELVAHAEHALARRHESEAAARGVVGADPRARLDRRRDHAGVSQCELYPVSGFAESLLDLVLVAVAELDGDVAGQLLVELRRAGLRRLARGGYRRQRLDVDLDGFRRVLRLRRRLGDHAGDRVADEAHLVHRQRAPRRLL